MSGSRLPLDNIYDSESRQADIEQRRERTAQVAAIPDVKRPGLVDRLIRRIRSRASR